MHRLPKMRKRPKPNKIIQLTAGRESDANPTVIRQGRPVVFRVEIDRENG